MFLIKNIEFYLKNFLYTQSLKNAKPNDKVIQEVAKILFDNFHTKNIDKKDA